MGVRCCLFFVIYFWALLNGIHYLFQYFFNILFVINHEGIFKGYGKIGSLLSKLKSFLIIGTPEAVYHYRHYYRPVVLDNKSSSFSTRSKGLGGALRERDYPVIFERPFNFSCIARIQTFSRFPGFLAFQVRFTNIAPARVNNLLSQLAFHCFFSRHIFYFCKRP